MKRSRTKSRVKWVVAPDTDKSPGVAVKEEPQEYDDIHSDALNGSVLDNEVEQHGSEDNRSEAAADQRLVSDALGNVLDLGRQLRLSHEKALNAEEKLGDVINLQTESQRNMREIIAIEVRGNALATRDAIQNRNFEDFESNRN